MTKCLYFLAGNIEQLFSVSNCAIQSDPFQFEQWFITKSSPGGDNLCNGGVSGTQLPTCKTTSNIPTSSVSTEASEVLPTTQNIQENVDSTCVEHIGKVIINHHKQELFSTYSRELKVTGNDNLVSGTYVLSQDASALSGAPVYRKEGNLEDDPNSRYIYYLHDRLGWRIGNKRGLSGVAYEIYDYKSDCFSIYPC